MENNYPCSSCVHNTYEPGYYVDRSLMCFYCSVYDPKQKYSQYSKVANKERQKVLNDLYGITDTLKYTTSSASTTFTLNDFHKAKALLDDIGDPWKELFERYGFSMETDVLILPGPIVEKLGNVPECVLPYRFITDGYFIRNVDPEKLVRLRVLRNDKAQGITEGS